MILRTAGVLLLALGLQASLQGQGIFLPAGGAVNRGMGGATTGTAIEAIGSMYWNPATISALPTNEMAFGFEAIYANFELSSTFPGVGTGTSSGEGGANPVPTIAWVHHTRDPNVTFGMGIFGVAGFSTNMRGDPANPILSPPPQLGGLGVGGFKSDALFFQMNPALSFRLSEKLSVGLGPVIGMGKVAVDENLFAPMNADFSWPRGDGTRYHWGLGAQLGLHYVHDCCWEYGANIKTPTWFEPMRYFSEDVQGLPRTDEVQINLPMIVSGGVAYKGLPGATLTADVRYVDYTSTEGFGDSAAYEADGRVSGLGWNDQFSLALGAQFQVTGRLTGRLGYIYASDLTDDSTTFFNIASDLSYRHVPTVGASWHVNQNTSVSLAYNYLFEWSSTGPYVLPVIGAIPGSSVTTTLDSHIATFGVNVRY